MALNFFLLNRTHTHGQRRENFSSCSVQDSQKWVCASCSSSLQTFLWQSLHHQHSHCWVIVLLQSQSVQPRPLGFFQVMNMDFPHTSTFPVLFLISMWHRLWQCKNYFTISYVKQAGGAEGTGSAISSTQIITLQSSARFKTHAPQSSFINSEFTVHISPAASALAFTGTAGSAEGAGILFSAVLT